MWVLKYLITWDNFGLLSFLLTTHEVLMKLMFSVFSVYLTTGGTFSHHTLRQKGRIPLFMVRRIMLRGAPVKKQTGMIGQKPRWEWEPSIHSPERRNRHGGGAWSVMPRNVNVRLLCSYIELENLPVVLEWNWQPRWSKIKIHVELKLMMSQPTVTTIPYQEWESFKNVK